MAHYYLDFEKPIKELEDQILILQSIENDQDHLKGGSNSKINSQFSL